MLAEELDRWEYMDEFGDDLAKSFALTRDFMLSSGLIDNDVDVTNVYTNLYLDEAKRLLGEE